MQNKKHQGNSCPCSCPCLAVQKMNTDTLATDPLSKRTAELRKLFAKGTGRKPNRLEAMAIKRAALLTAKCEAAALDPETTANDLVRLDGAARKARADMQLVLHPNAPVPARRRYSRQRHGGAASEPMLPRISSADLLKAHRP